MSLLATCTFKQELQRLLVMNCYTGIDMTYGLVRSYMCARKKSDLVRKRRELSASMRSLVFCYWVPATLLASFGLRCLHTVFLSPSALGLTLLNKELWMIFERDVRGGWDTYRETQIALHYSYFTWTWFFSTYLCFLSKYSTYICVSY